jgi:carboxyl-terminal processing protease
LRIDSLPPDHYHAFMPFSQPLTPRRGMRPFTAVILASLVAFLLGIGVGFGQGVRANGSPGGVISQIESTITSGTVKGVGSVAPKDVSSDVDFAMFWKVWNDMKSHYYKQPIDDKTLFYGALRGLASSVDDPYTTFFEPKDAQSFEADLKGEFSGIGAEIGMKTNQLQVIAPLPDSPAEKAGIRTGDYILKIDDADASTLSVEEAVMKIRGEKGTKVKLHIGRIEKSAKGPDKGSELDIEIVRDTIVVKSATMEDKGNGIYLIKIRSFDENVDKTFSDLVAQILKKDPNPKGVIVDVRNDPGGYLDRVINILGEWMPNQDVVLQRKQGQIIQRLKGQGDGRLKGIPTVVLINEGSASASEILAGALQDSKNATIVGAQSFGKGSVQDYLQYDDGSAVKITVSEWLTPKERSINKEGITPDVKVDMTYEDANANRDPQLDKALELLKVGGRS